MTGRAGPPVALTIAGSDSGAGAGIQADLKAMSALGVLATTAVTAVTAQNTAEVVAVHPVPAELVDAQIAAVLADLPVAATKTGLLVSAATIDVVGRRAAAGQLPSLVVDPVMVASTGRTLLDEEGLEAYRRRLLPHALLVTPNLVEAALLAGTEPGRAADPEAMAELGRRVADLGPAWVLVKGGHLPGVHEGGRHAARRVVDVLVHEGRADVLEADLVVTVNNHGTGCTLSAATAALLASGDDVPTAVTGARRFVHRALAGAAGWHLGRGHGPLDPFGWSHPR